MHHRPLLTLALLAAAVLPRAAAANERHLTYTYETATLPQGAKELEVWTTGRVGRHQDFVGFDHRVEFEVGLTNRLQTSFYLNFSAERDGTTSSGLAFGGVSSEWKYKITDPVADAIGFAGYGELTAGTDFYELEGKLIFDKVIGKTLLAANIVGAWEKEVGHEPELELELDLAAARFLTQHLSLGLEVRNHNELEEGEEWEHSALYAGPVLAYTAESWWATLSVLPQLPALKKPSGETGARVLDGGEKWNARLLFSFRL
ncbi:MAG TPA: DUF6662 family protein [Polyangia bacterium]|nr:DUF6662 family protein [Polyangia bacterium]